MNGSTLLPDLALGVVGEMTRALEARAIERCSAEDISEAVSLCQEVQRLVRLSLRSVQRALSQGMEAGQFAARYEPIVVALDPRLNNVRRLTEALRALPLPEYAAELLSEFQTLGVELARLHQFLGEALARARAAPRPIDPSRVREAQAAYGRGETKPFRKAPKDRGEE
jgi:hypothetical protein